jgi:hypothetical protein
MSGDKIALPQSALQVQLRSLVKRRVAQDLYDQDVELAETTWRLETFPPAIVPIPTCLDHPAFDLLRARLPALFARTRRDLHPDSHLVEDSGRINDLGPDSSEGSGQLRRVIGINSTGLRGDRLTRRETLYGFNHLSIGSSYWTGPDLPVLPLLLKLAAEASDTMKLDPVVMERAEPGFPLRIPQDLEVILTPPGCEAQIKHQDAHNHMVTLFFYLNPRSETAPFILSTHVADSTTSFRPHLPDKVDYVRHQIPCVGGYPTHFFRSHPAWPHYGPGSALEGPPRLIVFMSFPLTRRAVDHTTSEQVFYSDSFTGGQ